MINNITHINDNEPRYSDGDIYYYHGDHLGSATWITDATGAPVQYIQYLPTGEIWQNQITGNYNERFKFTGKEHDEESGYDYFGARYYWSLGGIWTAIDPLADKYPSNNPYMYCSGNPLKYVDPDGRDEWNYNEATCNFSRISDMGGTETDYYHFGIYLDDGSFSSEKDFDIKRNGKSTINSFRIEESAQSTISVFHIPDAKDGEISSGFFLERPGPDTNASGQNKRIPQGSYSLSANPGSSYPGVPRLYDSKEGEASGDFWNRGILIHVGNYPSNTAGCLLPGSTKGTNFVGNSKNTCTRLYDLIDNRGWNNVQLVIKNTFK